MIARLLVCLLVILNGRLWAAEIEVRATPVPLHAEQPDRRDVGRLEFLAGYRLSASHEGFGGFSDMEISAAGDVLRAVSDAGWFMTLALKNTSEGVLAGVGRTALERLKGPDGQALQEKALADAEAMAREEDGALVIAFERTNRLLRYPPGADPTRVSPRSVNVPNDFRHLPKNGGIESMVSLPGSRLLAFAEDLKNADDDRRGWLRVDGVWARLSLATAGGFMPTAMTRLPDGNVLLLERRFGLLGGFAARISVLDATKIVPGTRLRPAPLAELAAPLTVDNFECIAARRMADGSTQIYILSDDNFSPLQWTLLLQFRLRDGH